MKLKLDENLSCHLKDALCSLGHDAITAADEGLLSAPDETIAAAAKTEDRLLITLDVEFANLNKYPPGSHPGIFLFRPRSLGPLTVNEFVERFFTHTESQSLVGCVVVVDPKRVRVRWPERVRS